MWFLLVPQTFPELCPAQVLGTGGDAHEVPARQELTTHGSRRSSTGRSPCSSPWCPAPHIIWPLHPAPASPPGPGPHPELQTHNRFALPIQTSEPLHKLCLLPEMPFPLLILYNLVYLSPLLGSTLHLQAELATPPSLHPKPPMHHLPLHPISLFMDINGCGVSPSLGGGMGVYNSALCLQHSAGYTVGKSTRLLRNKRMENTWPQSSLMKQARTSLGMSSGCFLVPCLPLQSDRGLIESRILSSL